MKNSPVPAHILLVDDNSNGLLIRRALLEEQGYRVDVASCGEAALKLFEGSTFDLVVTDYRMPGMNGVELIGRLRALQMHSPIVLLSGFVEPLGLTEANTGANAVIAKSANEPAHLIHAIKRLLRPERAPRKPPASQGGSALTRFRSADK